MHWILGFELRQSYKKIKKSEQSGTYLLLKSQNPASTRIFAGSLAAHAARRKSKASLHGCIFFFHGRIFHLSGSI